MLRKNKFMIIVWLPAIDINLFCLYCQKNDKIQNLQICIDEVKTISSSPYQYLETSLTNESQDWTGWWKLETGSVSLYESKRRIIYLSLVQNKLTVFLVGYV